MTGLSVLMDTNAVIRAQLGLPMRSEAVKAVTIAEKAGGIFISVVSAWEIAMLARKSASRTGQLFAGDPAGWFDRVLEAPGVRLLTVGHHAAMASCTLPELTHRDPADRLLIAQARDRNLVLITRDRAILDYADAGHVRAIAC